MRLDFKFRHTNHSEELTTYVEGRVEKLIKFERKPVKLEFTFSSQKNTCRVDVSARSKDIDLHAHHESENFFDSADEAIEKITRQLERKKSSRAHQRRTKPDIARKAS